MTDRLEIEFHLVDGTVRTFVQDDAAAAARAVGRLHPDRAFDEAVLAIGSARSMATIRREAISRIELRGPVPEDWPFGPGIDRIRVADAAAYLGDERGSTGPVKVRTGDPYFVHAEVRDAAGVSLFLRVEGTIMPEAVRVHRLERLMDRPCLHARRGDGTAVLIQLANVALLAVRPSVQLPAKGIEATEVAPS